LFIRQRFVPGADQRTIVPGAAETVTPCLCAATTGQGIEQVSTNATGSKHQRDITALLRKTIPPVEPISCLAVVQFISRTFTPIRNVLPKYIFEVADSPKSATTKLINRAIMSSVIMIAPPLFFSTTVARECLNIAYSLV
jgi:hypothetical protein